MSEGIEFVTVLFGMGCAWISGWLSRYFYRLPGQLSGALAVVMAGESAVLLLTTTFAILAWTNHLNDLPYYVQTAMRWLMYLSASGSSYYLYHRIKQIEATPQ